MKKIFLTIFFLSIFYIQLNAQTVNEPIIVNVTYQFVHVKDLSDKENPSKTDMVLSVGKKTSRYIEAGIYNRLNTPKPTVVAGARGVSGFPIAVVNSGGAVILETFLQYPSQQTLTSIMVLGSKEYSTDNKFIPINWSIEKETRKIGGFNCQKAVGNFAGRTYTAWFAADLPFQNGPFKLWGLPGLILEAEDSKKEVRFLFKDINKETDSSKMVGTIGDSKPIKISNKEYINAKIAYQKSPDTYMQGQLSANSPKVIKVYENAEEKKTSKKIILNPIEL